VSIESALEVELGVDAVDAVRRVEVLDERDLEAGGGALAGSNGRGSEEVFPDLYCITLAINLKHHRSRRSTGE